MGKDFEGLVILDKKTNLRFPSENKNKKKKELNSKGECYQWVI